MSLNLILLLGAGVATAATLPCWRAWFRRTGTVDSPGHRKIHTEEVPLAGGPAVLTGLLLSLLAWAALRLHWIGGSGDASPARFSDSLRADSVRLWFILGGAFGMTFIGWLDDRYELRARVKFAGQLLVAAGVSVAAAHWSPDVPHTATGALVICVVILWILTVTNALNFADNMNGLCAGLGVIASAAFGLAGVVRSDTLSAGVAFVTCGALLGFLPFNYPRATVFLGDAGSHLVGYLLAHLALLPLMRPGAPPAFAAALGSGCILALPLADLIGVICVRWRQHRPFYVGDTNHFSHRLVRRGFTPLQAVGILWALAAAAGAAGVLFAAVRSR